MTSKSEITLEHFYIFNGTYAKKEGEASMRRYVLQRIYFFLFFFFQLKYATVQRVYFSGGEENIILLSGERFGRTN